MTPDKHTISIELFDNTWLLTLVSISTVPGISSLWYSSYTLEWSVAGISPMYIPHQLIQTKFNVFNVYKVHSTLYTYKPFILYWCKSLLPVESFSVTHAPFPWGTTDFNAATKNGTFSNNSPFWSLLSCLPFTSSEIQQVSWVLVSKITKHAFNHDVYNSNRTPGKVPTKRSSHMNRNTS